MSTQLIPFSFESKDIRVIFYQEEPWFVLRDILEAMDSKTTTTAAVESINQGLDFGFVSGVPLQTAGGTQQSIIVSESAVTYLLSRSNTDKGRELNRFIHIEVLPSIRKTGSYIALPQTKPHREDRYQLGVFRDALKTAQLIGFVGNEALRSADNYCRSRFGRSILESFGATDLLVDQSLQSYTPTELGLLMTPTQSARWINKSLLAIGFQVKEGNDSWVPTEQANGFFEWEPTGKRKADGTQVKQLKWFKEVIDQFYLPPETESCA